jgi:pimeloyl-ACP methyl ester carboxylesterase
MKAVKTPNLNEAELHLGKRCDSDYGKRYAGVVKTEDHDIPISWRTPHEDPDSAYVLATGWLGAKASMRLPAHEAVRAGHAALTFDYTNKGLKQPLERNVSDLAATIDALPEGLRRSTIGLSMGGAVLMKALEQAGSRVASATAVASAGFIDSDYSWLKVAEHFGAVIPEQVDIALRDPIKALYIGATTLGNCVRRPFAVGAELQGLVHASVHDSVRAVKKAREAPHMRFMYGNGDRLLPAWAQAEAVQGLPFDEVEDYHGGHEELLRRPALAQRIFELDSQLLSPPALELAA